jgi:hypothetical protein
MPPISTAPTARGEQRVERGREQSRSRSNSKACASPRHGIYRHTHHEPAIHLPDCGHWPRLRSSHRWEFPGLGSSHGPTDARGFSRSRPAACPGRFRRSRCSACLLGAQKRRLGAAFRRVRSARCDAHDVGHTHVCARALRHGRAPGPGYCCAPGGCCAHVRCARLLRFPDDAAAFVGRVGLEGRGMGLPRR